MVADQLDLRVDHAMLVGEEWRQLAHEDVTVLVDGGAQHGTAVLLVPGGIVGAAAQQRDAIRRPRDDHRALSTQTVEMLFARAGTCPPAIAATGGGARALSSRSARLVPRALHWAQTLP